MTAHIENLILEHLRAIRTGLSDVKERVTPVEINLGSLDQQVGALTAEFTLQTSPPPPSAPVRPGSVPR